MKLHELAATKTKKQKRVGRGGSSGKGKTAGRGAKGQKKRGKVQLGFEGGQLPLYQRLPQRRGLGNIRKTKSISLTTGELNKFTTNVTINKKYLFEVGLLAKSSRETTIKVVFNGKLDKKLNVALPVSKKAKAAIEKAGGKVTNEDPA